MFYAVTEEEVGSVPSLNLSAKEAEELRLDLILSIRDKVRENEYKANEFIKQVEAEKRKSTLEFNRKMKELAYEESTL